MKKTQQKGTSGKDPRRNLPAVSAMLDDEGIRALVRDHSLALVKEGIRETLSKIGERLSGGRGRAGKGRDRG